MCTVYTMVVSILEYVHVYVHARVDIKKDPFLYQPLVHVYVLYSY